MDGKSLDITEENLKQLQAIFPQVFTEGKIDFKRLQDLLGGDSVTAQEFYALNWAGKSESRKEIQKQTTATLIPEPERSINFDTTQNIFIEGENLEVLRTLQKSYFGKIKMIYIDPPYNTGEDSFVYPDDYSERLDEYRKRTGEADEEGFLNKQDLWKKNSKESGQYHSSWLSMMYPRLYLARNLMCEDGVIFISIDYNELSNLKLLCDEVFGEDNFRNAIIIKRGSKNVQMQFETIDKLGSGYEFVLMYTKNSAFRFDRFEKKLDDRREGTWNNHWRGTDRPTMRYELLGITPDSGQWRWSKDKSERGVENYKRVVSEIGKTENEITQEDIDKWYENSGEEDIELVRLSRNGKPEHYIPPTDTQLANDVWFDIPINSTSLLKGLFGKKVFNNPKPLELIKRGMELINDKEAIVLDFFGGSGTTAHAVLEMNIEDGGNRKFICVQMPEITDENSEAFKAGFKTIAELTRARITKVINKLVSSANGKLALQEIKPDWGFQSYRLAQSNFKKWNGNVSGDQIIEQLKLHIDSVNPAAEKEAMLRELLLKGGKPITAKAEVVTTTEGDFYHLPEFNIVVCLNGYGKDTEEKIIALAPAQIIVLDKYFERDDALSNARNTMREAGIEKFTVI